MQLLRKASTALMAGLLALLPNCREALRLQSDALDRPMPLSKRPGFWVHLLLCKWCRRYGRQIDFLKHAAHDHADQVAEAMPQKLSDAARERIKRSLRGDGKS
jgi:hypothetical protein